MMTTSPSGTADLGNILWDLPPLILHPFADRGSSERLLENSRHALLACGLAGSSETDQDHLNRLLLEGRFSEIHMLFFLGKDVVRWTGQCQEFAARIPELAEANVSERSFARLLTGRIPQAVDLKLRGWGVQDAGAIFARAIGLNRIFAAPPEFHHLAEEFVRNYHRYADSFFGAWMQIAPFREVTSTNFRFDLYASGEYTQMLENEWGGG